MYISLLYVNWPKNGWSLKFNEKIGIWLIKHFDPYLLFCLVCICILYLKVEITLQQIHNYFIVMSPIFYTLSRIIPISGPAKINDEPCKILRSFWMSPCWKCRVIQDEIHQEKAFCSTTPYIQASLKERKIFIQTNKSCYLKNVILSVGKWLYSFSFVIFTNWFLKRKNNDFDAIAFLEYFVAKNVKGKNCR